jgi:hypothetical protein
VEFVDDFEGGCTKAKRDGLPKFAPELGGVHIALGNAVCSRRNYIGRMNTAMRDGDNQRERARRYRDIAAGLR